MDRLWTGVEGFESEMYLDYLGYYNLLVYSKHSLGTLEVLLEGDLSHVMPIYEVGDPAT